MSANQTWPRYEELPEASEGGRSGWGMFGEDDNIGLLNLQTAERIVQAAKLIRRGTMFALDAAIDAFNPPIAPSRGVPRHQVLHVRGRIGFDDVCDNFYPQGSSQWDSLGHVGYAPGIYYNGATEDEVWAGQRNSIDHWARRGIAGRAVLLDMPRSAAQAGSDYSPGDGIAFDVSDLERARELAGVEFRPGDILILHTGFSSWYLSLSTDERREFIIDPRIVGIAPSEQMCSYLWDAQLAAIASDTYMVEVMPFNPESPTTFLHRMLIGQFGMALGELWWTEDLAQDCAEDGVYEVFLTSAPLNIPGGLGSPPNAIAFK